MNVRKIILVSFVFFAGCNLLHAKKASIEIVKTIKTIHSTSVYDIDSIIVLTAESTVPAEYYTIAYGKTGRALLTFKCSEEKMLILAKQKALEINAHAIQLYDIRPGSIVNTCHRFRIRFLVRKVINHGKK